MKILLKYILQISLATIFTFSINANSLKSQIKEVKLFQNRAKITRNVSLALKTGLNKVQLNELPSSLIDWSVRGRLPRGFQGKILSLEIEKKALLEKRNGKIKVIEGRIKKLREQDQQYLDELSTIIAQETFISSMLKFSQRAARRDLISGKPQIDNWDKTLNYSAKQKQLMARNKRAVEKKRETLGKKLQKLEHNLYQLAGSRFYNNFQNMNLQNTKNISQAKVQNYGSMKSYKTRKKFFSHDKLSSKIEKQINIEIYSKKDKKITFEFDYQVYNSNWKMKYDLRAKLSQKQVQLNIYGSIYQKTGENWRNIDLTLSTASPNNSISQPKLSNWAISAWKRPKYVNNSKTYLRELSKREVSSSKMMKGRNRKKDSLSGLKQVAGKIKLSSVRNKGLSFDITLPVKQKIDSSIKTQKKFIKEFNLSNQKSVKFYYEIYPQVNSESYIKTEITNNTKLPWLRGDAQLFLENEFMGKITIPYTSIGKKQSFILGNDNRVTATKKLLKKYEDTSGLFGGKRRIRYDYEIKVENNSDKGKLISIIDRLPYTTSSDITIELDTLSHKFYLDPKLIIKNLAEKLNDSKFLQGRRSWRFQLAATKEISIRYSVIIIATKGFAISGLK